jgi:hypothetical protein
MAKETATVMARAMANAMMKLTDMAKPRSTMMGMGMTMRVVVRLGCPGGPN